MTLSRREFLIRSQLLALAALAARCGPTTPGVDAGPDATPEAGMDATMEAALPDAGPDAAPDAGYDAPPEPTNVFRHGVLSGDPMSDRVILWTRVTSMTPMASIDVAWEVASDTAFATIVRMGTVAATGERDFTVKLDVDGLTAGTTYYYRFRALGETSRVGRTRTAPSGGLARARFAIVACSSYAHGYFHAYRAVARQLDLDAVVHLGDYIYEYATNRYGNVRPYDPPNEAVTLADYRRRYAHYRKDPDLQECHRQHPFITIWDDHETANDAWSGGAENHMPAMEGDYALRKVAAQRAYMEWMPIREQTGGQIFRKLRYGDLLDLIMLDTRIFARDMQAATVDSMAARDPARQLLGMEQETWLRGQLTDAGARWKFIGQQVMLATLGTTYPNVDQWDGYPAARNRFYTMLRETSAADVVVLTGDIHSSWAFDLCPDGTTYNPTTGAGSVAVEFVTPGVTSPGFPATVAAGLEEEARMRLSHLKFVDLSKRGYMVLDVTMARVQCAWYLFDRVDRPDGITQAFGAAFSVARGAPRLTRDAAAIEAPTTFPAAAP